MQRGKESQRESFLLYTFAEYTPIIAYEKDYFVFIVFLEQLVSSFRAV